MLELNQVRRKAISILVLVIMAIAATGITNSVLMAAFERVREIGALRALGMSRAGIATMFALEGLTMGVAAALVGATLGMGMVLHWEKDGILLGEGLMNAAGEMGASAHIYTHFSLSPVVGSVLFAIVVAQLAALYPMYFATRLNPADAVRAE